NKTCPECFHTIFVIRLPGEDGRTCYSARPYRNVARRTPASSMQVASPGKTLHTNGDSAILTYRYGSRTVTSRLGIPFLKNRYGIGSLLTTDGGIMPRPPGPPGVLRNPM